VPLDQDSNEAIFRLHFGATLPFPARRTRSPEIFFACGERWRARLPCRNAVWIATSWVCIHFTQKPPNCLRAGQPFLHEASEDCNDGSVVQSR
jgi:hypothetical protein